MVIVLGPETETPEIATKDGGLNGIAGSVSTNSCGI